MRFALSLVGAGLVCVSIGVAAGALLWHFKFLDEHSRARADATALGLLRDWKVTRVRSLGPSIWLAYYSTASGQRCAVIDLRHFAIGRGIINSGAAPVSCS